jgi:hypothetical protein
MTPLALLWYYLIIVPHLLLVVVLVPLLRRRLYRQFPIFSIYIVAEIIQFVVLFAMIQTPSVTGRQYGIAYSFGLACITALNLGVIYEICAHLFRNDSVLGCFGKPLFKWITLGLLLSSLILAVGWGGHDISRLMSIMHVLERTASILQCGLLVGIFVLCTYLGLSWRSHVFGIALGLGVFSSIELAASAIRTQTGIAYTKPLDYLTMATYHCCVLIWAFYLWAPERSSQYTLKVLPEADLESWNQELRRLLNQ